MGKRTVLLEKRRTRSTSRIALVSPHLPSIPSRSLKHTPRAGHRLLLCSLEAVREHELVEFVADDVRCKPGARGVAVPCCMASAGRHRSIVHCMRESLCADTSQRWCGHLLSRKASRARALSL